MRSRTCLVIELFFIFLSLLFHFCYFSSYGLYIYVSPHRQHIDMEENAHVEIVYF
jgi:hypothetical protein